MRMLPEFWRPHFAPKNKKFVVTLLQSSRNGGIIPITRTDWYYLVAKETSMMEAKNCRNAPSNRDKILECATELFYRNGYPATSVDDILRGCHVAKSNFYYHFKTKEELACAVLDARFKEYETAILGYLQDPLQTPRVRIARYFEAMCKAQNAADGFVGCPFGNFAATLGSEEDDAQNERFRKRLSYLFQRLEGYIHSCLLEGVALGEFRADLAPAEIATFLVGTAQGLMMLAKTHKSAAPLEIGLKIALCMLQNSHLETETSRQS